LFFTMSFSITPSSYNTCVAAIFEPDHSMAIAAKTRCCLSYSNPEQHVTSTEKTRDSYLQQFNIGQRSLLDLLDTENEVFSSKNAFIEAVYDHMVAQ